MSKSIIQLLKDNWVPFGGWPEFYGKELGEEMQEKVREMDIKGCLQIYTCNGRWEHRPKGYVIRRNGIYRLRPDYKPEQEIEECEIYEEDGHLHFMSGGGSRHSLSQAYDQPDFAGTKFKPIFGEEVYTELWLNLDIEQNGNHKMTHASHVLFLRRQT